MERTTSLGNNNRKSITPLQVPEVHGAPIKTDEVRGPEQHRRARIRCCALDQLTAWIGGESGGGGSGNRPNTLPRVYRTQYPSSLQEQK